MACQDQIQAWYACIIGVSMSKPLMFTKFKTCAMHFHCSLIGWRRSGSLLGAGLVPILIFTLFEVGTRLSDPTEFTSRSYMALDISVPARSEVPCIYNVIVRTFFLNFFFHTITGCCLCTDFQMITALTQSLDEV